MNTVFKKVIMLFVMMGIFLLPISASVEIKKDKKIDLKITENKVSASNDTLILNAGKIENGTATFTAVLLYSQFPYEEYYKEPTLDKKNKNLGIQITLYKSKSTDEEKPFIEQQRVPFNANTDRQDLTFSFKNIEIDTDYYFNAAIYKPEKDIIITKDFNFKNPNGPAVTTETDPMANATAANPNSDELDLRCNIFNPMEGWYNCIAGIFWLVFKITAWIASFAGHFLDFFIYYSTDSTSYKSEFISKGWGAVRDIANIFFIIALLYIAIKMILSLDDHHGKKMITTIIMVALIINFSLFITQVVIDGSNILAKVFYNNIDSKYDKTGEDATGKIGEKTISTGLMDKFDPEKILTQEVYDSKGGTTLFIILTMILTLIIVYTAYIFFTVTLLFVSRVVMLWLSMIFAPIAFASYTLPFEIPGLGHRDWWKQLFENAFLAPIFVFMLYMIVMFTGFLKELVQYPENADLMQKLMATVIPFILLVVLLKKAKEMAVRYSGEMGGAIQKAGSFIGGAAVGIAAGAGGFALRATAGRAGSAIANSGWANKMANSEKSGVLGWGSRRFGTGIKNVGNAAGKGSFDVRGAKIAGQSLGSTGLKVNVLGGPNVGGFEKQRKTRIENRQRKANKLEVGDYEPEMKALKQTQADLKVVELKTHADIEKFDKIITTTRQKIVDAKNAGDEVEKKKLDVELKNWIRKKEALENGTVYQGDKELKIGKEIKKVEVKGFNGNTLTNPDGTKIYKDEEVIITEEIQTENNKEDFKKYTISGINGETVSLKKLKEKEQSQKHHIDAENIRRREVVASEYATRGSKTWNKIITLGQYDEAEKQETINQIRSGAKAPAKEKKSHDNHGGGGHGGHGGGHEKKEEHKTEHKDDHASHDSHAKHP